MTVDSRTQLQPRATAAVRYGDSVLIPSHLFAAFLDTVQLCLGVCLLSHQPVRGVQRVSGRLRSPGPPPLAAAESGPVPPRWRDGDARRGDPLTDGLQTPAGPRR